MKIRRASVPSTRCLLSLLSACGGEREPAGLQVARTTAGDTTIIRTERGSEWGAPATLVPEVAIGELNGPEEYLRG